MEELWSNWRCNEGHCNGCPNRHEDLEFTPFFGYGGRSARVAFVGEGPRDRSEEDKSDFIPSTFAEKIDQGRSLRAILIQDTEGSQTTRLPERLFDQMDVTVDLDATIGGDLYYYECEEVCWDS